MSDIILDADESNDKALNTSYTSLELKGMEPLCYFV